MMPPIAVAWLALLTTLVQADTPPLEAGRKRFTESCGLGETARQALQQAGVATVHKPGLGNTGILDKALASGAVNVDPVDSGSGAVPEACGKDRPRPACRMSLPGLDCGLRRSRSRAHGRHDANEGSRVLRPCPSP